MSVANRTGSEQIRADVGDIVINLSYAGAVFVGVPICLLWAIGILSSTPTPITFRNWLAALVVMLVVRWRR